MRISNATISVIAVAACMAVAEPAAARWQLITFDNLVGPVTSYTEAGMTFTRLDGAAFGGFLSPNGTYALPIGDALYRVTAPVITSGFSALVGSIGPGPFTFTIEARDANDVSQGGMIGLKIEPDQPEIRFGAGFPQLPGSGIVGGAVLGRGALYLDDAVYDSGPVPEPRTWALLVVGIGMIGLQFRQLRAWG